MVVGDERRLAQAVVVLAVEHRARAQRFEERRLRHTVEVQVVLPDELKHARVVGAPEVAPAAARQTALVVHRNRERDRRPERFGPAPHGEPLHILDDGSLHAPLDVARDAERHERLRRAEADARTREHAARQVAVVNGGELDLEARLALLGGTVDVLRQIALDGLVCLVRLVLDEDHGRREELADGLRHHGAHLGRIFHASDERAQEVGEGGQIEVPVLNRTHFGNRVGQRRLRRDEIGRRIAMAEIALVGVGVLGLAALHGAAALHLAAVEERARLGIVELQRGLALEPAVRVELLDEGVCDLLVHLARMPDARAVEDVEAHLEIFEGALLRLVVAHHVVLDRARELPRLDEFAVALVDGRAEAVGARHEAHIFSADAVAQESREGVGGDEHAADVAEVQRFVAVGHARRHHGAARPFDAFVIFEIRH